MRNKSPLVIKRNKELLERIKTLKIDHPLWGYRRIWSYLKFRENLPVNKKRVFRLMKEHQLLVTKNFKLKAKRTPLRPKPHAQRPNHLWGIDMTKIKMSSWGWLYLVVVLDWYTKEIIGYSLSIQSKTEDWLSALNNAINSRFLQGIKDSEKNPPPFLVSDNGCQPTSRRFMQSCSTLGIKQIFASWSNPKGNSDTERVLRTLKEDLVWCYDWDNPFDFELALDDWIYQYNTDFPHQALNNQPPTQFYLELVNDQPKTNQPVLT